MYYVLKYVSMNVYMYVYMYMYVCKVTWRFRACFLAVLAHPDSTPESSCIRPKKKRSDYRNPQPLNMYVRKYICDYVSMYVVRLGYLPLRRPVPCRS